jgi:hypothetical protein
MLRANLDDLELITDAAADIEVNLAAIIANDAAPPAIQALPNLGVQASITTAATTMILDTSAITNNHNVRLLPSSIYNNHATQACGIRLRINDGTNTAIVAGTNCTLLPGEGLYFDGKKWFHYTSNAAIYAQNTVPTLFNASTVAQGPGFSADTYLTGSFIKFARPPKVGTKYKCRFSVSKTGAGTATPIVTVRVGTAGTTSDTGRGTHTFSAGTAATDVGWFEVSSVFRSVGSGTSAVLQSHCALTSQPTTGFSSLLKGTQATSGGFDSTVADLGIGVSVNGGTSAAWTVQMVVAEIENND